MKNKIDHQENDEFFFDKLRLLYKEGKYKKAIKVLNKAIKLNSNDSMIYLYIKAFFQSILKKYKDILKTLDKIIELNLKEIEAYCDKASILINDLHKYKKALKIIDKGLLIDPYNERLIPFKIEVLMKLKRKEEFSRMISKFTRNNPKQMNESNFHMYI